MCTSTKVYNDEQFPCKDFISWSGNTRGSHIDKEDNDSKTCMNKSDTKQVCSVLTMYIIIEIRRQYEFTQLAKQWVSHCSINNNTSYMWVGNTSFLRTWKSSRKQNVFEIRRDRKKLTAANTEPRFLQETNALNLNARW